MLKVIGMIHRRLKIPSGPGIVFMTGLPSGIEIYDPVHAD